MGERDGVRGRGSRGRLFEPANRADAFGKLPRKSDPSPPAPPRRGEGARSVGVAMIRPHYHGDPPTPLLPMSAQLRLALAQFDFPVGAVAANTAKIRELMTQAHAGGADLVVFPELAISGYPPEDLLIRPSFLEACNEAVAALAEGTDGLAALVGFPHSEGEVYNAAALLREGRIECVAHKQALPNYGVFDDKRYFRPGHASATGMVNGVRVGFLVCEDIWEPEPAAQAASTGAELIVVINASPWDDAKQSTREALPPG